MSLIAHPGKAIVHRTIKGEFSKFRVTLVFRFSLPIRQYRKLPGIEVVPPLSTVIELYIMDVIRFRLG